MLKGIDNHGLRAEWPLDGWPEWTALYRIVERADGELVIAELNVRHKGREVPIGGLPARLLRNLPTSSVITEAREVLRRHQEQRPEAMRRELLNWGLIRTAQEGAEPVGRGGHSDEFLAEIAALYVGVCRQGSLRPSQDIAKLLASEALIDRSPDTVSAYIRSARKRGLLTPAPPGRSGGELTARARDLLRLNEDDKAYIQRRSTWIRMAHPDIEGAPARVTVEAFEQVWKDKGWQIVGEADPPVRTSEAGT